MFQSDRAGRKAKRKHFRPRRCVGAAGNSTQQAFQLSPDHHWWNQDEMYSSPEVEWRGPHVSRPMDMRAVVVVATVKVGVPFTEVRDNLSLPQKWNRYLGEPPQEFGFSLPGDVAYVPGGYGLPSWSRPWAVLVSCCWKHCSRTNH